MASGCGRRSASWLSTGALATLAVIALMQIFSVSLLAPDAGGVTSTQPLRIERRKALSAPAEESAAKRRFPSALLIGVRKGGTRALLDALALHPRIKAARREVHYFDDEANFAKGEGWYLQQMPLSGDEELTLEKTPAYFTSPAVPERVRRLNAAMKIILIVREPVTRAISDFTQVYYNRLELNKSLPNFADLAFTRTGEIDTAYKPVRNSLYSTHLRRWLEFFPLDQILVLDGDRFAKDPLSQLRLAEDFLELPHEIRPDQLIFNPAKGFHCFRKTESAKVKCLGRSKGRPHREIDARTQSHLSQLLRPHNRDFYRLINRVFDW